MSYTLSDLAPLQSGQPTIDALIDTDTITWRYTLDVQGNTLTFAFPETGEEPGFVAMNAAQRDAARAILAHATTVTGITFREVSDPAANLRFATHDIRDPGTIGTANTGYTWQTGAGGVLTDVDRWVSVFLDNVEHRDNNIDPDPGEHGYFVLLHEIGHALGLKHPFEGAASLPPAEDTTDLTVMSYTEGRDPLPSTFQEYDVAAFAHLYSWLPGSGGGGSQSPVTTPDGTFTVNGAAQAAVAAAASSAALGMVFELILTALPDAVIGTAVADFINGGAGNDAIQGGGGGDILDGGLGSNFLSGNAGTDIFFVDGRGSSGQAGTAVWSTVTDFADGTEQVTVWGWRPGVSTHVIVQSDGTAGYTGGTLHADLDGDGVTDASLTLTGLGADALSLTFGMVEGNSYVLVA